MVPRGQGTNKVLTSVLTPVLTSVSCLNLSKASFVHPISLDIFPSVATGSWGEGSGGS